MEPNVDRGMWAVVALLAAIAIGGLVLVFFPKIAEKITGGMNDAIDDSIGGDGMPDWAVDKDLPSLKPGA